MVTLIFSLAGSGIFLASLTGLSLFSTATIARAADDTPAWSGEGRNQDTLFAVPATIAPDATLDALEKTITDVFRTRIDPSKGHSAGNVAELARSATIAGNTADDIVARLEPYEKIFKTMLDVLGPAPAKGAPPELPTLTAQRDRLLKAQNDLSGRLTRARLCALQAHQLVLVLSQRNNAVQQAMLLQRFPSPLAPAFWSNLSAEFPSNIARLRGFAGETAQTVASTAESSRLPTMLICFFGAAILFAAPFFLLKQARRAAARLLPDGRVRRIAAVLLYSACCAGFSGAGALVFWLGITGASDVEGSSFAELAGFVGSQIPLVGFMLGAGASMLAAGNPDWRVVPLGDATARALTPCTLWFALLILLRGILRYVDTGTILGPFGVQTADIIFVFIAAPLLFITPRQIVRQRDTASDETPLLQSTIGRAARILAFFISVFCGVVSLIGYIPLGYTTLSWICSMVVTGLGLSLVFLLVNDLATTVFTSSGRLGMQFVRLGISPRLVDQGCAVISGLFSILLVFVAIAVAQSGGDFDFSVISGNIGKVVFGQHIGGVTLSFDVILKCIAIPVIGHYLIRLTQNWLRNRLFPTTNLDVGSQTSIVTIFTYAAWILICLTVMSTIGITVSSMTWVVSALSVGIGFGLQSIVQNFVSGIILLAERPVTIGDLVQINGTTGDIRRISVRSTDIGLSDGSTMIVPNSQFITSAVRNVTLGHPTGAMSVSIGLPLGTDLTKAVGVMSKAMDTVPGLLKDPPPSVTIASIAADTVTLTASGKTSSPRNVDSAANAVRLALWTALHENGIVATVVPTG
nr:DUF3772 domain-containing protein [Acetobacter oeni]